MTVVNELFVDATLAVAFISGFRAAFPDIHHTIEATITEDERVVVQWRATGTHRGAWGAISPTQQRVAFTGITLAALQDGKIQQQHTEWDKAGLLAQFGR